MDDGSPGLREKWEREGENEREGGKWGEMKPGCFCRPFRNSKFFFFFWVTWKAPRQHGMDAGWTLDGRLELLIYMSSDNPTIDVHEQGHASCTKN
jgi:hypothetical protein